MEYKENISCYRCHYSTSVYFLQIQSRPKDKLFLTHSRLNNLLQL